MKQKQLYQIRNEDGLYSKGGDTPYFNENGKVWKGLGPLRNHFALIGERNKNRKHPYEDCEIVEIEMVPKRVYPAMEEIIGSYERSKKK